MSNTADQQLGKEKLLAYLLAGSAIGGGGALAAGLYKMLNNNRNIFKDNTDDDEILYISKKAGLYDGAGIGLAIAGGLGSYILGDKIIDAIRKQQAQDALDEAQEEALSAQGYRVVNKNHKTKNTPKLQKKASDLLSGMGTWTGALGALLMLTGGVATYHYLDNEFPMKDDVYKVKGPKKIKVVDKNTINSVNIDDEDQEILDKVVDANIDKQASALDVPMFMLYSTDRHNSMAANVVNAVARGYGRQFEKSASELGFANALNLVKGAATNQADPVAEALAIMYCTKEASFAPQFNLLVASEFATFNPDIIKSAKQLNDKETSALQFLNKKASAIFSLATISDLKYTKQDLESMQLNKQASCGISNADAILDVIYKQASSFLITNNLAQTATELSGNGTAQASSKDKEQINQEAQAYKSAMQHKDTINDFVDDELSQAKENINFYKNKQ